ncbi:MAG: BtpA/SgcQ family protein [Candidatus Sericytochromatia bacterium]|nr:BtpA/SgcQ family protein [Candidatus Sericytochromatia bacterium]
MRPDWLSEGTFPLVGVVHLPALPGAPDATLSLDEVVAWASRTVSAFREGGIRVLILENYGDRPFVRGRVPAVTVASLTVVAERLRALFPDVRWGINVLRNDGASALAVAHATGADFVRVNVLVGAVLADQGVIQGEAWELAQLRRQLATKVALFADVVVKHAVPLAPYGLEDQARDAVSRGGADALILSGVATGSAADPEDFTRVRAAVPGVPLLVGSGFSHVNVTDFLPCASGAIVASALYDQRGCIAVDRVASLARLVQAGQP